MKSGFRYTGIRARDLDRAIDFFARVLGMKLEGRAEVGWTKGEFANLRSGGGNTGSNSTGMRTIAPSRAPAGRATSWTI